MKKPAPLRHRSFSRPKLGLFILAFALVGYLIFRAFAASNPNLPGDLNNDNTVNITDLSILLSNYGTTSPTADINSDGSVNIFDLSILLSHYGESYIPPDTTSPTVALSAPASGAQVSGASQAVSAAASDNVGVVGVQFRLDGANLGTEDTSSPYSISWDTTKAANGSHSLTAAARDAAGNTATSLTVAVTVNNATGLSSTCGALPTAPSTYSHVVWVWMENKTYDSVFGSGASSAPYENNLKNQCAYGTQYLDNAVPDLPSEPNYLAATSGSNCNTGNDTSGSGCIVDDNPPSSHTLSTVSIFQQITSAGKTWKSYQEDMGSNCNLSSVGQYAVKHNPAAFYTNIRSDCNNFDVSFPGIACSATSCPAPASGSFSTDINNGTLPAFSFVTPNMCNDTHDCAVAVGDQWLSVWLPKLFAGPNYQSGNTAIFLIWDEGSANVPTPNIFISPYIHAAATTSTVFNHFAVLRAAEEMLGLSPFLGCASGTAPGGGSCPSGSTVEIRPLFGM